MLAALAGLLLPTAANMDAIVFYNGMNDYLARARLFLLSLIRPILQNKKTTNNPSIL
jgi:hypothetical protein